MNNDNSDCVRTFNMRNSIKKQMFRIANNSRETI